MIGGIARYHLYSTSACFVVAARVILKVNRHPMVIRYQDRYFVRHTDGNYYESDFAEHVDTEQHLQDGESCAV